MACDAFI